MHRSSGLLVRLATRIKGNGKEKGKFLAKKGRKQEAGPQGAKFLEEIHKNESGTSSMD